MLPAIIIGIGGTGKWVVTHLKHDIMASNGGDIPDNIELLSFDLAAQEESVIEILTFKFEQGKKDRFTLDFSQGSEEFCNFSGYWAKPIFSIAQGRGSEYPYIHQWLKPNDAKAYKLSRGELDNTGGVGQKRQGSRTSFFLRIADVNARLRDAINRVRGKLDGQKLRVFIITSIAGGTGCGSFIDFCYLIHHWLRDITAMELYGFVVLPKGFEGVVPDEEDRNLMEGNSFAAFRELHRFMCSTDYSISYSSNLSDVSIPHNVRSLLDACYLVDGSRIGGESGSEVKPFLGLLPAISDYISLHLIEGTAPDYAFLLTSMGQEVLRAREDPLGAGLYSTFGIYKYIFDVEGVIQTFAHRLAMDVLSWFLANSPRSDSEIKGEVQSFLKSAENSHFNRNCVAYLLEHPGDIRPMKESLYSFLRFGTGENIEIPTLTLIERVPISRILPFPSRVPSDSVRNEVTRLVNNNIGLERDMATPTSRENSYYGVLNYYLEEHDRKFRSLLKDKIKDIMTENNGEGGLDHAKEFLSRLESSYGQFIRQITDTFEKSGSSERRKQAQEEVSSRRENMNGGNSQRAFVEARQRLLEFEQLELIMTYIISVAEAHQTFCQSLLRQIGLWISTFENGRGQVQEAYNNLIDVRRDRIAIKTREYLTRPEGEWENKLYGLIFGEFTPENNVERELNARLPHPRFTDITGTFSWQFGGPGSEEDELGCYLPAEFSPWEELKRNPILWNYHFVNNFLARGQFGLIRNIGIMDILAWQGKNPASFSNDLLRNSGSLAVFDLTSQQAVSMDGSSPPVPQDWQATFANWTNVQPGQNFSTQLRDSVSSPQTAHNQYEIVHYQAKHLIKMSGFTNLENTESTYRARIAALVKGVGTPPLHIFPAENNAAYYEDKMPSILGEDSRCLNLRVVGILEAEEVVRDFAFTYVYDLIPREHVGDEYNYVYNVNIRGREEKVVLGKEAVDVLENLCSSSEERYRVVRDDIHKRVSEMKSEKAKEPLGFAEELRQKFNDIEVGSTASVEDDLKRVIKIILWQQVELFEKEAKR